MVNQCWCRECNQDTLVNGIPYALTRMILCPTCGNKRCPKATNHTLECTNSNEVGQSGSWYSKDYRLMGVPHHTDKGYETDTLDSPEFLEAQRKRNGL